MGNIVSYRSKYSGDLKNGRRHGWGICAFADRSYYEGEWEQDQMHGEGKYVRPDGSTYEGYWANNLQNGFGRLCLSNGDVFEGNFRDGKMDGYGTLYYKNGSVYDGEFMEDEAHGVGTFKGVNGEFYQGEWQADKQHGSGVYRFVSGARYRGEWKYGKMDGYGIYENLEGQKFIGKYEGQMIQGKMDGLGLYCWAEGDVYIGEYSQDKRHGSGIYTSIKGAVYKGEYDRGNRHGWGEYVNSAGDVYQGQWSGNARHGQAVVTMSRDVPDLARDRDPANADLRRWAQVWFMESEARPVDTAGNALDIDPIRTYTATFSKGQAEAKRAYRQQDWADIQSHVTLAVDNATTAADEAQRAVLLARKGGEYGEDAARTAVKRMADEAQPKSVYLVQVARKEAMDDVLLKHQVQLGPAVTRDTHVAMLAPAQVAALAADKRNVSWVRAAPSLDDDAPAPAAPDAPARGATPRGGSISSVPLSSVPGGGGAPGAVPAAVERWLAQARRRRRRDAAWHPHCRQPSGPQGGPGHGPLPPLEYTPRPAMTDPEGLTAARDSDLRAAIRAVADSGFPAGSRLIDGPAGPGPPRPSNKLAADASVRSPRRVRRV